MDKAESATRPRLLPPRLVALVLIAAGVAGVCAALWAVAAVRHSLAVGVAAAAASVAAGAAAAWAGRKIVRWDLAVWAGPYLLARPERVEHDKPLDVCFFFADHFEPDYGRADADRQLLRVRQWQEAYARAIEGHSDSDGRCPRHTWFFPVAQTVPAVPPILRTWPARGWGEIEYHLHHDASMDEQQIADQIRGDLVRLGDMGAAPGGRYGFVHGMFALAGGDPLYCHAVNEIDVLLDTGCYGDFTFGSIGTPAQPRKVNAVYYARSTGRAKPYDDGDDVRAGRRGQGLLLIPGPMHLGFYGRLADDAHVEPAHLPHPRRIGRWLKAHVHVRGRPNWVFIGVHSHTAREDCQRALLSGPMQTLWSALENRFARGGAGSRLHYVTAREAYNIVRAAEAGCDGNPGEYRDFEIPPPANAASGGPS